MNTAFRRKRILKIGSQTQKLCHLEKQTFHLGDPYEETNLATDSAYDTIVTSMTSTVESYVGGIYSFSTSGKCVDEDMIIDGFWVSGCCNV